MSPAAPNDAFEQFQRRVAAASAIVAGLVVGGALVAGRGYTSVAGGLAVGFAASLACHALKVWSLRRLRERADRVRPSRAGFAVLARLAVCAAALGVAAASEWIGFVPAAGGLLLVNGVTVMLAVVTSRRPMPDG